MVTSWRLIKSGMVIHLLEQCAKPPVGWFLRRIVLTDAHNQENPVLNLYKKSMTQGFGTCSVGIYIPSIFGFPWNGPWVMAMVKRCRSDVHRPPSLPPQETLSMLRWDRESSPRTTRSRAKKNGAISRRATVSEGTWNILELFICFKMFSSKVYRCAVYVCLFEYRDLNSVTIQDV